MYIYTTLSLSLREGEYLDLRGRKWWEVKDYIMRSFITCMLHQILLGSSSQE